MQVQHQEQAQQELVNGRKRKAEEATSFFDWFWDSGEVPEGNDPISDLIKDELWTNPMRGSAEDAQVLLLFVQAPCRAPCIQLCRSVLPTYQKRLCRMLLFDDSLAVYIYRLQMETHPGVVFLGIDSAETTCKNVHQAVTSERKHCSSFFNAFLLTTQYS